MCKFPAAEQRCHDDWIFVNRGRSVLGDKQTNWGIVHAANHATCKCFRVIVTRTVVQTAVAEFEKQIGIVPV